MIPRKIKQLIIILFGAVAFFYVGMQFFSNTLLNKNINNLTSGYQQQIAIQITSYLEDDLVINNQRMIESRLSSLNNQESIFKISYVNKNGETKTLYKSTLIPLSTSKIDVPIYTDVDKRNELGRIVYIFNNNQQVALIKQFRTIFNLSYVIFIVILIISLFIFTKIFEKYYKLFTLQVENIIKGERPKFTETLPENVHSILLELADDWREAKEKIKQFSSKEATLLIAKQVAHDIRSPLSALDIILKDMSDIPESKRVLIRNSVSRIHDIANDLLERNRSQISGHCSENSEVLAKFLLSAQIENIVSEKRVSFRSKRHISIETSIGEGGYGLFSKINQREFKRAISNLINNSVEALGDTVGKVDVRLSSKDKFNVEISIVDNGKGIPPEVLEKLGKEGESHGKEGGSGLGLFHTKKTFENWGGSIKIESALGVGTTIILLLPKATPPKSFVSELVFQDGDLIAVVDDDQSIHNIWEGRIASLGDSQVRLIHFSDPHEFMAWSKDHKANHYLIDFEFIGSSYNGLKIIRELNLQENVCLVTSRFEEENIITECEDLCIGLIPKGLAGFISSRIEKKSSNTEAVIKTILIDDDALIRMVWESEATEKSIPFMKNKVEVQPVKSGQRATAKKPRITQNLTSLFIIIQPFFAFLLRPIRITFDVNNMSTCG